MTKRAEQFTDRVLTVWITSTLNIITGSNGGRPPLARSE
jgi:hypothetical protein